ncbi:RNA methyltransferase [Phycicoccus sp. HDW14]|uniref:RNA methyltransferase n=1 Tax=Phycicoccus sp. HDW14 TaxID=2714941 RepID=UPI001407C042|nr:RNA methyltransferase [Phycicoccus sp. HDW14]QIM22240.1 RNA methyltransferase [Phycicoccus sp. HDW14]
MAELHVTSATNPRLKAVAALRRRRVREEEGMTVVDGYDELELAVDAGVVPDLLLHCPELMLDPTAQGRLVERVRALSATTIRCGRAAFEKVAYREGPDGFLAVVPVAGVALADLPLPPDPLVVVVEGLEKPGNLGSVLRSADAAGAAAVVAADPATDWGNPNVVRASKGTVFTVPVAAAPLPEVLGWLRDRGLRLVATTPDTEVLHTAVDWRGGVAIAVGTEKTGLTDAALAAADERVRIPMAGRVNSLNAGVSAAVVLYEAVRQRS